MKKVFSVTGRTLLFIVNVLWGLLKVLFKIFIHCWPLILIAIIVVSIKLKFNL